MKTDTVIKQDDLFVVRINEVPTSWTQIAFWITMPDNTNDTCKFITNEKAVDAVSKIEDKDYNGYMIERIDNQIAFYQGKEHDSIRIDPAKNHFYRNSLGGETGRASYNGSVIDFVMHFTNQTQASVINELKERVKGNIREIPAAQKTQNVEKGEPGKLELPESSYNMRRVYAYLIKSRGLAAIGLITLIYPTTREAVLQVLYSIKDQAVMYLR